MHEHKRKRKITRENLDDELSKAICDLMDTALTPIYNNGKLRILGYFSKLFIDACEPTPDIVLDFNSQSNAIIFLPPELQNKIFYHLRHPIAELIRHDWVYLITQRRHDVCDYDDDGDDNHDDDDDGDDKHDDDDDDGDANHDADDGDA